jgi:hypothetical protein
MLHGLNLKTVCEIVQTQWNEFCMILSHDLPRTVKFLVIFLSLELKLQGDDEHEKAFV